MIKFSNSSPRIGRRAHNRFGNVVLLAHDPGDAGLEPHCHATGPLGVGFSWCTNLPLHRPIFILYLLEVFQLFIWLLLDAQQKIMSIDPCV